MGNRPGAALSASRLHLTNAGREILDNLQGVVVVIASLFLLPSAAVDAGPKAAPIARAELAGSPTSGINDLGPENGGIAREAGLWDVIETVWDTAAAAPAVTGGLVAERRMIGSMLQETLRPSSDPARTLRIDYLTFNRVEGRWEYVSMDTRAAVGIMTAQSYDRGLPGEIAITFQPFSVPGPGPSVSGPMLRMREEILTQGPDRDRKDQYFTMADGGGVEWLAHRYDYVRRH